MTRAHGSKAIRRSEGAHRVLRVAGGKVFPEGGKLPGLNNERVLSFAAEVMVFL